MRQLACVLFVLVFAVASPTAFSQFDPHPKTIGYTEPFRNQFHFSPKTEWMNDINALIYLDGQYHMIYQWGDKIRHGGYAVSPDLLHWTDKGVALIPQESLLPKEATRNASGAQVYSGSGVVVSGDTATKITGSPDQAMIAIYTGTKSGTCLAWSNDAGVTWHDYSANPVANATKDQDPRDPCVFWYEPTKSWILALYENGTTFYSSQDLIQWQQLSNIDFGFECPDMFELPLDGDSSRMKWVLHDANGSYLVGQFDGKTFSAEQEVLVMDVGPDFYAAQTFFRPTMPDNAVIQIAWNDHWNGGIGETPWQRNATFPVVVGLITREGKMRVTRTPFDSINQIYKSNVSLGQQTVGEKSQSENALKSLASKTFDMTVVFDLTNTTASQIQFMVANKEIIYDINKQELMGKSLKPDSKNHLTMRMLVDWSILEIFSDDGVFSYSEQFAFDPESNLIELYSIDGQVQIISCDFHEISSTWR